MPPRKTIKRKPGRPRGLGLPSTKPEPSASLAPYSLERLFAVVNEAMSPFAPKGREWIHLTSDDLRHIRSLERSESADADNRSVQVGPTLALLQERIAVSIDQAKKQFDRLDAIGNRICGPAMQAAGDDGSKDPQPGGAVSILNYQLNVLDRMMARIDDQIARLESL